MARWAAPMQKATTSTSVAAGSLTAAAASPRRARIYDIIFGAGGTPADNNIIFAMPRCTTAGTATAVTPTALDAADSLASTIVCGENHSADPTGSGVSHLTVALNQRATFRWVAAPGGELIIPATASNGFKFSTPTAANTPQVNITAHYEEL